MSLQESPERASVVLIHTIMRLGKEEDFMKKIIEFTHTFPFLIIISLVTLVFWTLKLEDVGIILYLALMLALFVFSEDTMPIVPLLFNALFMVSKLPLTFSDIPIYLYLTPVVLVVGMVIHALRFKMTWKRGKMLPGILIMVLAMFLSSFNAEELSLDYWFYASIGIIYGLLYLFFVNSFTGDHRRYLLQMMFILGILISLQIVIHFLQVDDFMEEMIHKEMNLGWGISNQIATYLVMFIVITVYYIRTSEKGFLFVPVMIFQALMLLFTLSRGGIAAFILILPLLVILTLRKSDRKLKHLIAFLISIVILVTVFLFGQSDAIDLFNYITRTGFDDNLRFALWEDAWNVFKSHPLFGGGIFARQGPKDYNMYHNTFLHVLATMGVLGFIGLMAQMVMQFKITLGTFNKESLFVSMALLGAHIHGMVDNVYLMPQFMILMLIIVAVFEVANVEQVSHQWVSPKES